MLSPEMSTHMTQGGSFKGRTNCFSPIPAGLSSFRDYLYVTSQESVNSHIRENLVARAIQDCEQEPAGT